MTDPITVVDIGDPKHRDEAYPIKTNGLFVIMTVTGPNYKYKYHVKRPHQEDYFEEDVDCVKMFEHLTADVYKPAVHDIKKTFKLLDRPKNLIEIDVLTTDIAFDGLKKKVIRNIENRDSKPSFLMFFLMAPALESGQFLLKQGSSSEGRCKCKGASHTCEGNDCYGRRISGLVTAIQQTTYADNKGFAGIPKIFIIQTISGSRRVEKETHPKGPRRKKHIKPDDYVPRGSDTFIFYVHTEEKVEWIKDNGFYLITELCNAIRELEKNAVEWTDALKHVFHTGQVVDTPAEEGAGERPQGVPVPPGTRNLPKKQTTEVDKARLQFVNDNITKNGVSLELHADSLTGSWFDNLCTTATAMITNFLNKQQQEQAERQDFVGYSHMRAQISSTLRLRLSTTDILRSQDSV